MYKIINTVEKKLVEQMRFSEREIARRLHLINFTDQDSERIKTALPTVKQSLNSIIEEYYDFQLADPEMSSVIGDADTLSRLKVYLKSYILSLFEGVYDSNYVNTRLRIGKVHKRLDVRPKLYMQAHAKLQNLLDQALDAEPSLQDTHLVKRSIHKILLFDAELVFDAYVEAYLVEMQSVTEEVERYASEVGIVSESMFGRLYDKSQKDSLTDLYNRRALYEFLKYESQVAKRHHLSFVLIYLDLNGFKAVNDVDGHHAGDLVLMQLGKSMMTVTRSIDICARYGGDEFCILLPRTSLDGIETLLSRLAEDFGKNCPNPVTLSMGVVQVGPNFFEEPEELIQKADALMYKAKERAHNDGKHHWEFEHKETS